jgi:phosphoribosylformylglycinamidine cyclo-ligase
MFNTFNMGIGFVLVLAQQDVKSALEHLEASGFPAWEIGRIEACASSEKGTIRFVCN